MKLKSLMAALLLLAAGLTSGAARCEVNEITIAQQFGVAFLPLMLMERDGLIEKHAKAAGITLKTNWQKVAGPSVINDDLRSPAPCTSARSAPRRWSRSGPRPRVMSA